MLIITEAQEQLFTEHALRKFREKAIAFVKDNHPDRQELSKEDIEAFVDEGLQICEQHKIEYVVDVLDYLKLMMIYGRRFDIDPQYPWAQQALAGDVDGEIKLELLVEYHEDLQSYK